MKKEPFVELFTFCYNEEKNIPFVIPYWKYMGIDHITVFDNGSTDSSLDMLSEYPDWIEVVHWDTGGTLNDNELQRMKNTCWKGCDADCAIVCDMDEVPYMEGPVSFKELVDLMVENGCHYIKTVGMDLMSEEYPEYRKDGGFVHSYPGVRFFPNIRYGKSTVFLPALVEDMNYSSGAHVARPVSVGGEKVKHINGLNLPFYTLHLKKLGFDRLVKRHKVCAERLSEENLKYNLATEYCHDAEFILERLNMQFENSFGSLESAIRHARRNPQRYFDWGIGGM